jgi:hypothetical protein
MDIKQEELIRFWKWVFGENFVEFAQTISGELVVYRRKGWNKTYNEWNIDAIPSNPDLNLLYQFAIPKLQNMGLAITLIAFEESRFNARIITVVPRTLQELANERADSPTEALYNAIMKVIDNEVK